MSTVEDDAGRDPADVARWDFTAFPRGGSEPVTVTLVVAADRAIELRTPDSVLVLTNGTLHALPDAVRLARRASEAVVPACSPMGR